MNASRGEIVALETLVSTGVEVIACCPIGRHMDDANIKHIYCSKPMLQAYTMLVHYLDQRFH